MSVSQVKVSSKIEKGFKVEVDCSVPFVVDQPKEAGGNGEGPNPLELLLSALSSCMATVGRIVAMQQRIRINNIVVEVEGDVDKTFIMEPKDGGRAGFTEIRTLLKVDGELTEEQKADFLAEVEKRCPVTDNLASSTNLIVDIEIV